MPLTGRRALVVVTDDEQRLLCLETLRAAGCEVTASAGVPAPHPPGTFDVLVCDDDHVAACGDIVPAARIIALSAVAGTPPLSDARATAWLTRPVAPGVLVRAVQDALDTGPRPRG